MTDDRPRTILALLVLIGFFVTLYCLLVLEMPETTKEMVGILVGALGAMSAGVVSYYFGSSSGSKQKTAALEAQLKPGGSNADRS